MANKETRTERDSMGDMEVPADAYYGASTQRAVLNFPISDLRFPRRFIQALGLIKQRRRKRTKSWACSTMGWQGPSFRRQRKSWTARWTASS